MSIIHLPADAPASEAIACVEEHGYVIIDKAATPAEVDAIQRELEPYVARTQFGQTEITGTRTRRTGALIARSPTARKLIMHPTVLAVCKARIPQEAGYHISLTEMITLSPGAKAQFIHRDELGYGAFPFPVDYEPQVSTLWAMTEYTEEMGATRVIPGSHRLPSDIRFEMSDTVPAVMERGSVLIYSGKLYHGGGENKSDRLRQAMNVDYGVGWTRQEENQYLSCPPEIARTLPADLLKLMGYEARGGWGRVGDWIDPLSHLMGGHEAIREETGLADVYSRPPEAV
ncbi:MAG TPA: phytanoyl-CoA dioxygenase family protein [Novosphingobium sp.]|nr:phytanoyl-CoA dioxygenase family protein [Novosphingobium sp.]